MRPLSQKKNIYIYIYIYISQKRVSEVVQGVGPEFKPQYHQKRERKRERCVDPESWTRTMNQNKSFVKIFFKEITDHTLDC
jgi:hypothetical protein